MTSIRYIFPVAVLLIALEAPGADINGYNAKYECRAGGAICNVNVAALATQQCEQTISESTAPTNSWSVIDWSKNVICIAAGDHTQRGTLTLAASGSAAKQKVLRYYRGSDDGSAPWAQSAADRARVLALRTNGQSYWLIDRVSFTEAVTTPHIVTQSTSQHVIFNRILTENLDPLNGDETSVHLESGSNIWLQNSVVRNCVARPGRTGHGIDVATQDLRVVNNEVYNCGKQIAGLFGSNTSGLVVENNDVYIDDYTDCRGSDSSSGNCGKARNLVNINTRASDSSPMRYVQNRIWGMRPCDTSVACSFGGGNYAVTGGYDDAVTWVMLQNNIIFDSSGGIMRVVGPSSSSYNQSTVGNILYNIKSYQGVRNTCIGWYSAGGVQSAHEVYLNTMIGCNPGTGWAEWGNVENSDIQCNVVISSDTSTGSLGPNSVVQNNAYYDATSVNDTTKISNGITTRTSSKAYSEGTILRTSPMSDCVNASDSACFLYKVVSAGTASGSTPNYCTQLGCTMGDGSMTVQAIRAPYTFKRKLRTTANGELVVIPYARVHASAPEAYRCPSTIGTRAGIGAHTGALF